jgi:polysaccharide biosynthesis/export protein
MKKISFLILTISFLFSTYSDLFPQRNEDPSGRTTQTPNTRINADAPELLGSLTDINVQTQFVSIEGALDPAKYIIGPNDRFTLGLYGFINQQVPVSVSPEGSIVIPTVGEIKVSGLTLQEAKSRVVSAVKKRYYSSDVSFTLTFPRNFLIKVSGLVQGTYEVSSVTRVSEILKRLYYDSTNVSSARYSTLNQREFFLPTMSMRNIELHRKNGEIAHVDIYKYFIYNDDRYNPYFLEGDFLKIPYNELSKKFITINGAVQLTGTYEYAMGDDLETVIGLGRGFDVDAEPDSILIYRPYGVQEGFNVVNLSYEKDKKYNINNYDRIFVKYKLDYQKNHNVLILGQVERPGYYPITFKNTRIMDAIEMAGGLRDKAYLPLSILFRNYDQEYNRTDTTEILMNMRANDLLVSDEDVRNFDVDIRGKRNRVVVDFEKLFNGDMSHNVVLDDKDIIYINDDKNIVYVFGQVGFAGYVPFEEGKDYNYYIERAGGFGLAADEKNVRIIKFNSRGWYKPGDIELQSGDFVYVPKETRKPFGETITIVAQIAGVLLGILTTYILINQNK